jgi:hypothetical protein
MYRINRKRKLRNFEDIFQATMIKEIYFSNEYPEHPVHPVIFIMNKIVIKENGGIDYEI